MPRPLALLSAIAGLALLGAGVLGLAAPDTVGEVPTARAEATTPRPPAPALSPPPPSSRPAAPAPPPAPAPTPVAAPTSLSIPAIGVTATAVKVGLEPDGSMEIPEDVTTVGWYELGVAPGTAGSAVIAGHVDSRSQGPGAFFDLDALEVDDEATVAHEDGTTSTWRVTGRTSYPKDEAPLPELFRRGGSPQLTLITCGGAFDATARSYAENVVVVLEPV